MDPDNINDVRKDTEFRGITFSKFQKSKAKQELIKCLYDCKIENACYWCAEFVCSGHYLDLWDIIILYYCKYIHCGNPKLPIYLEMRYQGFINIINNGYSSNILILRNNKKIRQIFSEIICVLCYCKKKNTYQNVKLYKEEQFDLTNISEKFKAPNVNYLNNIFKEDDPKELYIPINELIYSLIEKNIIDVYFWYEWIIEYENICKKKKKKCSCQARNFAPDGHYNDIIWIIWDIIFYYSEPSNNIIKNKTKNLKLINKTITCLFKLFTIRYNNSVKRKRKLLIYYCFTLLTENIDFDINIINNQEEINAITQKIDAIYREIKKNEISPQTDYLFKNVKVSNIEKTIEKIEMMNNIDKANNSDDDNNIP
jgi:hypothetical protein